MTTDWRDVLATGLASSGGLAVAVAVCLVLALRWLLPPPSRRALRMPTALIVVHLIALLVCHWLPERHGAYGSVSAAALFLLLAALGRLVFLLLFAWLLPVRLKRPIPKIFRDIIQVLVYALVALVALRAMGVELGSLLTTSALLTAVIGLSMQETLGNLFAGLALQAESPFQVGDWIQFEREDALAGRVTEINWRATKMLTNDLVEVVVPNSILAKSLIRNHTRPSPVSRRIVHVQAPYSVPPGRVQHALLEAVEGSKRVLSHPAPEVVLHTFADSGIEYALRFFIDDFANRAVIDSDVRTRIWYAFQRAGISIPFPIRDVFVHGDDSRGRLDSHTLERLNVLRGVDFLDVLPLAALEELAHAAQRHEYAGGRPIVRQGEEGEELFIIQSGAVAVVIEDGAGERQELARLGPGKVFGELAAVTGGPRTATIVATCPTTLLAIRHETFSTILEQAPELRKRIASVLVRRQSERACAEAGQGRGSAAEEEVESALLRRIRQFFSL